MPSEKGPQTSPRAARRGSKKLAPRPPRQLRNRWYWFFAGIGVLAILGIGTLNHILAGPLPTDTPRPSGNGDVIGTPLVDGGTVGASGLPVGNTRVGGQGSPVDGISCEPQEYATLHVHAHLALFVNGVQKAIPGNIGIVTGSAHTPCL